MSKVLKPEGTCSNCKQRPATQIWAPEGTMGFIHGGYTYWCLHCVLNEQLEHAVKLAATIPDLKKQLENLDECRCSQ